MKDWLAELCGGAFMPHGQCYLWNPPLIWLHVISDSLITLAYYSIPLTLVYYVRKGRDVAYPAIFLMFAAFIVACGTTHLMEVWSIWHSQYWISGGIKALTAAISLTSAVALVRIVPRALELPSREELRQANVQLEERVRIRTSALLVANEKLRHEITQRQEVEAEVRRLNTELQRRLVELQALFNLMPVGVGIATDSSCRELRFNAAYADMHGLPPRSVSFSDSPMPVPQTFRVLQGDREIAPEQMPMPRAVATNTPVRNFEKTIVRADGTSVEILANAVPIRDEAGRARGCVATFQDITAHKLAERQRLDFERKLLQSQKLESIGVLAGGIAHDFNNLLQGVLGNANLARIHLASNPAEIDPLLEQVESSAQRAAELCRQLLAYAGKGRLVVKLIDLNVSVEHALPLLRLSVSKKITLDLQLGPSLPPFRGDATQLNQVLMNLVTNASEAIGDRVGTITLRTQRVTLTPMDLLTITGSAETAPGTFLCLTVSDNGCGIPPEAIGHIFEPFFTTKFIGRGLGLAAVLGIVQGHHGGVRVSSRVGEGTTFELFFPVSSAPANPAPATGSVTTSRAPAAPRGGTVLVVDDEEPVRKFALSALGEAGFTVITANDGEEALAHMRRNPTRFDVVLLDLTMPRLDGEDTLVALRMIAPTLPVVLTSGYQDQTAAKRFVGRGVTNFLPKPYIAAELVACLVEAMASAPRDA